MDDAPRGQQPSAEPAAWVERRLAELRQELVAGEERLAELDEHRRQIRDTLLRIGGAIQVLEEWRVSGLAPVETAPPATEVANGRAGA